MDLVAFAHVRRYLIDAIDLGHNTKGISRVLGSLVPHLVRQSDDAIVIACTAEGRDLLGASDAEIVVVHRPLQSRWEQWDLPRLAKRVRADAVYSHRECGPLWGSPLVLHVPEDPEVRWARNPRTSARDRARQIYSRALFGRAVRHAAVVAASTPAIARQLARRHGLHVESVGVIPLGVDLDLFHPAESPRNDEIFHLGSSDPRDRSVLVVEAWATAREASPLPKLVIGGALGEIETSLRRRASELKVELELTGRLDDEKLASHLREAAVVVQPSSDEGFGLQPLEAMASGAPVVVTQTPAVKDVVGDGAIFCRADPVELAQAIRRGIAAAIALRSIARRHAENYSWTSTAEAVLSCLARASDAETACVLPWPR